MRKQDIVTMRNARPMLWWWWQKSFYETPYVYLSRQEQISSLQNLKKKSVVFWSFKNKKRDQLNQWECTLKRLFHVAKCTDYMMMVTRQVRPPIGSNMRLTTHFPFFSWPVRFCWPCCFRGHEIIWP